ncbi:MAG: DUF1015 domain-containing protein [Deltaproteobacteria bacterium]|nr:DUF1015 domain-containing protein [Deltaproteobacteria bacterium]
MASILPFAAIRPRPDVAADIVSPPYDVVSDQEMRALVARHPKSFMRVIRPEVNFPPGAEVEPEELRQQARANLLGLQSEGLLLRDDQPTLYLYRQTMGQHRQIGVVAAASIDEYDNGLIKRHEHTRSQALQDRVEHIEATRANTGLVFLTYRADAEIDRELARHQATEPLYNFVDDNGVGHTVWRLSVDDASALQSLFAKLPQLYIADGHHRSAAGSEVRRRALAAGRELPAHRRFLAALFADHQLNIMAYNRVVTDLGQHSAQALLAAIRLRFPVSEVSNGQPQAGELCRMWLAGKWYGLGQVETPQAASLAARLPAAVLQSELIGPLLGIEDVRADPRISFVGGIRGLPELTEAAGAQGVAFSMPPVEIEQMLEIADAGEVMPPKSTWFEPKLLSGLFVRSLES